MAAPTPNEGAVTRQQPAAAPIMAQLASPQPLFSQGAPSQSDVSSWEYQGAQDEVRA